MRMNRFVLKFLWLDKTIGVSLDQRIGNKTVPITEYFFWPRTDAWEDMRLNLENKSWISEFDLVLILNQITEVINAWQEKEDQIDKTLFQVREKYPDCLFIGRN